MLSARLVPVEPSSHGSPPDFNIACCGSKGISIRSFTCELVAHGKGAEETGRVPLAFDLVAVGSAKDTRTDHPR